MTTVSPLSGSPYVRLTTDDGLSDMIVNAIYRDSSGIVWLGTSLGINRFDGREIVNYSSDIHQHEGAVYGFIESDSEGLLAGGSNGLWRYDRYADRFVPVIDRQVEGIRDLARLGDMVVMATADGIVVFPGGGDSILRLRLVDLFPEKPTSKAVNGISVSPDGTVWMATDIGAVAAWDFDHRQIRLQNLNMVFPGIVLQTVYTDEKYVYYGTRNHGLLVVDPVTLAVLKQIDMGGSNIKRIFGDSGGSLYVATDGNGVRIVSRRTLSVTGSIIHNPTDNSGIASNSVYCFYRDRYGIGWLGHYMAGVNYTFYHNDLFRVYRWKDRFDSARWSVRSLWLGEEQKMIGTRDGLFWVDEKNDRVRRYGKEELGSSIILSVCFHHGQWYVGTHNGGLWTIGPETGIASRIGQSELSAADVYRIEPDTDGMLWFATDTGLFRYDPQSGMLTGFDHRDGLPGDFFHFIAFDRLGNGWIAGQDGIGFYDRQTGSFRTVESEIYPGEKICLSVYPDGETVYFLTYDLIYKYDTCTGLTVPISCAGYVRSYSGMIRDRMDRLWIATSDGIFRSTDDGFEAFGYADHIPDLHFNACVVADNDGILWFGSTRGLLSIDPGRTDSVRSVRFPVHYPEISIDGNPLDSTRRRLWLDRKELVLGRGEKTVTVLPWLLDYSDPRTHRYRWRADDGPWNENEGHRPIGPELPDKKQVKVTVRFDGSGVEEHFTVRRTNTTHPLPWILACVSLPLIIGGVIRLRIGKERTSAAPDRNRDQPLGPEREAIEAKEKYRNNKRWGEAEATALSNRLTRLMETEKPYLDPNLNRNTLGEKIGCSSEALSQLLTVHMNESYYDFINRYRVGEFIRHIQTSDYSIYTLSALARQCGFNSQASFYRSFRKFTGKTPKEFIQEFENSHRPDDGKAQ